MTTIDEYVDLGNQFNIAFQKSHPFLHDLTKRMYADTRWGFDIMDDQHKVIEAYTLILDKNMGISYELGNTTANWDFRTTQKAFDEMVEIMKDSASGFTAGDPVKWCISYLPREIRNFLRGDFRLRRS